jgi:hypothetical protein
MHTLNIVDAGVVPPQCAKLQETGYSRVNLGNGRCNDRVRASTVSNRCIIVYNLLKNLPS